MIQNKTKLILVHYKLGHIVFELLPKMKHFNYFIVFYNSFFLIIYSAYMAITNTTGPNKSLCTSKLFRVALLSGYRKASVFVRSLFTQVDESLPVTAMFTAMVHQ